MNTKKIAFFLSFVLVTFLLYAQKNVTTFLGIPVDGYKSEMKKKLIEKGFTPKTSDGVEFLEGKFNGSDVRLFIETNNNLVYRIALCDVNMLNEADIRIRFNTLVSQFERNQRYYTPDSAQIISEDEDISYGMLVKNKVYEASFCQKDDSLLVKNEVLEKLNKKYSKDQLDNPNDDVAQDVASIIINDTLNSMFKRHVWFKICDFYGKFYITMYYDNIRNQADGEDL